MKKALIMCHIDPNTSPRPNRMILLLKDSYDVTVLSRNEIRMDGVKSYVYNKRTLGLAVESKPSPLKTFFRKIKSDNLRSLTRLFLRFVTLVLGRYEETNWLYLGEVDTVIPELAKEKFDLIISHDLVLLPVAFHVKGAAAKVMLDAREYYPRNFDDNWFWRVTKKRVNEYLCKTYLKMCDKVITVSPGLSDEYRREYGIDAEVVMSLPALHDLQPSIPQPGVIRMIHHGNATTSRKTELMLEMMDYVDERFTLDLMMVVTDVFYWSKIVRMAEKRKNVRIVSPVPMREIVSTINQYDIGLFLVPPSNFNLTYALPNKLFEFIQARLAVAIGPSIDMKKIVEKYNCGIVSQDFSPQSLAQELNKLTFERIMELKQKSHEAALELNAEVNGKRIQEIVSDLTRE